MGYFRLAVALLRRFHRDSVILLDTIDHTITRDADTTDMIRTLDASRPTGSIIGGLEPRSRRDPR